MKILGFIEYLNEGSSVEISTESRIISEIVDKTMKKVIGSDIPNDSYYKVLDEELHDNSLYFDLRVYLKTSLDPNFNEDPHFKKMKWHKIKFDEDGFAIDANSFISEKDIPEIEITIIIDANRAAIMPGKDVYDDLNNRLHEVLYHEITHLNQVGINKDPFNEDPHRHNLRKDSKNSYKYFILPEEIEAMVGGMYRRSKLEDTPLDTIFIDHLKPYLSRKFLNRIQMEAIILIWIKYALENYPGVHFTDKYINFINNN